MKIAFIPTINKLNSDNTNYHMALTHLVLKYPSYAQYYKDLRIAGEYVILDNSLIELGGSVGLEVILKAAEMINPNEIVLPDVYMNGKENMDLCLRSIEGLKENNLIGKYKLNTVCHGVDRSEWEYYWQSLNLISEIDCISIPKVTEIQFGRYNAVKYALQNKNKEIHLLGVWYGLYEFFNYTKKELDSIRGCDTSLVIHNTIMGDDYNNLQFKKPDWKIDLEIDYELDDKLLLSNQNFFIKNILGGK